jgi:hypothetical protein
MNSTRRDLTSVPLVPVSWGELLDKITILEVKRDKILAAPAQANILTELSLLTEIAAAMLTTREELMVHMAQLRTVNLILWQTESRIRRKEEQSQFDEEFIRLARQVYKTNDERAAIKRRINELSDSVIVEEKNYHP